MSQNAFRARALLAESFALFFFPSCFSQCVPTNDTSSGAWTQANSSAASPPGPRCRFEAATELSDSTTAHRVLKLQHTISSSDESCCHWASRSPSPHRQLESFPRRVETALICGTTPAEDKGPAQFVPRFGPRRAALYLAELCYDRRQSSVPTDVALDLPSHSTVEAPSLFLAPPKQKKSSLARANS